MTRPDVVVVIPTVTGREEHLDRCMRAYKRTLAGRVWTADVVHNAPTCGEVWNHGALRAVRDGARFVHMTADDLEPMDGWFEAAVQAVDEWRATPAALIITAATGAVESHGDWGVQYPVPAPVSMSRIPFCRPEQWIDIPPIHYFSDNAFSSAMQAQGVPIIAAPEMVFRHHWAQEQRKPMNDANWNREHAAWQAWANGILVERAPRWS